MDPIHYDNDDKTPHMGPKPGAGKKPPVKQTDKPQVLEGKGGPKKPEERENKKH